VLVTTPSTSDPTWVWACPHRKQYNLLPVTSVRDLGVHIDSDLTMRSDVVATIRFAPLRQIRSVRRSLSRQAVLTLVRALVVSKVDYCNSVVAGVSVSVHLLDYWTDCSPCSTPAHLLAKRSEHVSHLLSELHWLRVPERIRFRLCVLAYCCLSTAPSYLTHRPQHIPLP